MGTLMRCWHWHFTLTFPHPLIFSPAQKLPRSHLPAQRPAAFPRAPYHARGRPRQLPAARPPMAFLSPAAASRGDDYARLLASPAALLPSPLAQNIFGTQSPGAHKGPFAVQEGRLSFDVLLQEHDSNESSAGVVALEGLATEVPKPPLLNSGEPPAAASLEQPARRPRPCRGGRPCAPAAGDRAQHHQIRLPPT